MVIRPIRSVSATSSMPVTRPSTATRAASGATRREQVGPVAYREVDDITKAVAALVEAGARERPGPRDVGGGKLVATVTDPDGNVIGVLQPT